MAILRACLGLFWLYNKVLGFGFWTWGGGARPGFTPKCSGKRSWEDVTLVHGLKFRTSGLWFFGVQGSEAPNPKP